MANNYGSLEGTMDANGILGGEIQFNGAGGKVKDVQVNDVSVVDANGVAKIDLTPYAEIENVYDKQTIDTALEGKADTDDIPTELSDLTDDENHRLVTDTEKSTWDNKADVSDIPTVNNPTITIQKNGQNVDTFSLNQTADKVIDISVPTKTSDLQNDSSFITNTVNNLANYYLKSQTYTQAEVDALIDAAVNGRFQKVNVLPATGEPNIIYLVPKATPETSNACDEYIWQDNAWELIGSTDIDLSGYVTDDELTTALADYLTTSAFNTAIANYYTKTEIGNLLDGKVDKVPGKGLSTNDYDNTAKGIVDGVTNALAGKVDKVNGKGLSTEDYTTTEKNKLAGISTNAKKVEASTTNGNIKIDDTETQVYDDSEIQDKIDETTTSISGNPISIPNLKSNQLAVNPIITLEPIQAGSGTPSPSNIRAISGYDTIEVISANGSDPTAQGYVKTTDISESLGQTVYWGELDVRSGKFKVIGQYVDLSGLTWVVYQGSIRQSSDLETLRKGGRTNIISDRYEVVNVDSAAQLGDNQMCGNRTTGVIYVKSTTPTGYAVYELATPFYIQLTPHEISLLKDYAYVSTNGTNISLDYHNGELASLADVAQLGQTVEELGRPQARICQVDISSYTSSSNRYTIPFDGYITVSLPASSNDDYLRVYVYTNKEETMGVYKVYADTRGETLYTIAVKKGMKAMMTISTGYIPTVTFRGMA